MRDDIQGGLLATAIAAPVAMICCGGGGVILSAILAGIGGWLTGLGVIVTASVALVAALTVRQIRRKRSARPDGPPGDVRCRLDMKERGTQRRC